MQARIVDPAITIASDRYRQLWRAGTVRGADGIYSREIDYCGLASMAWTGLYGPAPDGRVFWAGHGIIRPMVCPHRRTF